MPKRIGNLYQRLSDRGFVKAVLIEACKDRPGRSDVARVKEDLDGKTEELCRMLEEDSFRPRKPNISNKYDPSSQKTRVIRTVPFFPDCCVQWCIVELLRESVLMRGMDAYCCASIPGRGGIKVYRKLSSHIAMKRKRAKYALQCDVRHYYDSISIPILMRKLRRRCKDERLLSLIERILHASATNGEDRGLSIGFYLNQWFANFFLEDLDRTIRESRLASCFVRYMDNITVVGSNKRKLQRLLVLIRDKLGEDGLELKGDWQIYPISARAVDAVGYRYFASGAIMLRKRSWKRFRRQVLRVERKQASRTYIPRMMARGFLSRAGNMRHLKSARTVYSGYISRIDTIGIRRVAA